jgi:predicted nuclease of predicted toxin-antitoxin system
VAVRFLADANLDQDIVDGILRRESRIDFLPAVDAIPERMKDPEVLALAATLDRVLVTHDVRTMPRHFGNFLAVQSSPGVILVPTTVSIGQAIDELILIWHTTKAEEWRDRIVRMPI